MAYGQDQEHEAQVAPELEDLGWNTHEKIREAFRYPTDPEFFGEWLLWFYEALSQEQRRTLRYTDLTNIDRDDYPSTPRKAA